MAGVDLLLRDLQAMGSEPGVVSFLPPPPSLSPNPNKAGRVRPLASDPASRAEQVRYRDGDVQQAFLFIAILLNVRGKHTRAQQSSKLFVSDTLRGTL